VDDAAVKGPQTHYKTEDGNYETIPQNPGIRRFIWEHLQDVHRILYCLCCAGATVSAKKLVIASPEIIILGHKCNYDGRIPDKSKIVCVRDWPSCKTLSDVRAFLGLVGFMRIWIRNYSALARPLVNLTHKGTTFVWHEEHESAMQALKEAIITSSALISINYNSDRSVFLLIDLSWRGVGWILAQECANGRHHPARFSSISWNEHESCYSQAKVELYGLFRTLCALRLYTVRVKNLVVEMDAQYVQGMLKNPDIQPNTTINRWIAAILLFDFKLVHVPVEKHHGPDGLSRCEPADGESEDNDPEDWIDATLSLGLWGVSLTHADHADQAATVWTLAAELPADTAISNTYTDITHANFDKPDSPISANPKAHKADEELKLVHRYLSTLQQPDHLDDTACTRLLKRAKQFFLADNRLWHRQNQGRHQLYIPPHLCVFLIRDAHDNLGHRGFFSTCHTVLDRFWWPSLEHDVKWYISTCHQCQLRQTTKIRIPPTIAVPAPLFCKVHVNTMFMPPAGGFRYITQACCSLTTWPEWHALRIETGRTLGMFLFEDILCRWGAVKEIVTDNGTPYVATLDWLADRYGIRHIHISPYNSRANGIVERQHRTIRDSLVKACKGDDSKWLTCTTHVFWANHATIRKSTGYSPFYMAHGVEPLLPFDITLATFLVPNLTKPLLTTDLIAIRAHQLKMREDDLASIRNNVLKACLASVHQFKRQYKNTLLVYDFKPSDLVLVRNSTTESIISRKTKPRYVGPMVVLRRTCNVTYCLAELDGAVSKLRYAAFQLVPYFARSRTSIPVTRILDCDDLAEVVQDLTNDDNDDSDQNGV